MAVLTITINETARTVDTDDLTLGFFEDLETAQASGKMKDFIPVLAGLLGVDRETARAVTMRQWQTIAQSMREAATVPPTSA